MASNFLSNIPLLGEVLQNKVETGERERILKCGNVPELVDELNRDMCRIFDLERQDEKTEGGPDNGGIVRSERLDALNASIAWRLARLKNLLYEEAALDNAPESKKGFHPNDRHSKVAEGLTTALVSQNPTLLSKLLSYLPSPRMPFESRKDVAAIFTNLMVRRCASQNAFVDHTSRNYDSMMTAIVEGIGKGPDTALLCGSMLRSTLSNRALNVKLLSTEGERPAAERYLYPLLDTHVHDKNFVVASDALATIREIFLTDRITASEYLERDYDNVFVRYNTTLKSQNYITRRMSLKLLGEILLDRPNFNVMMRYISSKDNLRIAMMLLSDPSPNIQFEAFHVFKIFVANPNKPEEIVSVLTKNKVKLVAYLEKFHLEREVEDEQFREEKGLVISTLYGLEE